MKGFFSGRVSPILAFLIALLGDQLATAVVALVAPVFGGVSGGLFRNFHLFGDGGGAAVGFASIFGLYVVVPAVFTFVYFRSITVYPATSPWLWLQVLGAAILVIRVVGVALLLGVLGYLAYTSNSANG